MKTKQNKNLHIINCPKSVDSMPQNLLEIAILGSYALHNNNYV